MEMVLESLGKWSQWNFSTVQSNREEWELPYKGKALKIPKICCLCFWMDDIILN